MKLRYFSSIALLVFAFGFSQYNVTYGDKFEFKQGLEKDLKLVLSDNYNHYLQSHIGEKGGWHYNSILVRKFDQKNNLVELYVQAFPKMEQLAFTNYLGSMESGVDKLIFFTETYSNKLKKKEIHKIIFDKSNNKFSSSVLATYPIESLMKSGNVSFQKSENGKYGAIVNYAHSPRKEPSKMSITVIDGNNTNTAWQKDITIPENGAERSFFVTNNSNVGLVRIVDYTSKIVFVNASKQEEKFFPEKINLQDFKDITIGSQEYLIAFNHKRQGVRLSDFENIMLYDLNSGKVLSNTPLKNYDKIIAKNVEIPYTYIYDGKIYAFTEAKVETGKTTGTFPESIYSYTNPAIYVLNSGDGKLDSFTNLSVEYKPLIETNHSFGILNAKGRIFFNNTYTSNLREFALPNLGFKNDRFNANNSNNKLSYGALLNQLIIFKPNSQQLTLGALTGDGLSLLTFENFIVK